MFIQKLNQENTHNNTVEVLEPLKNLSQAEIKAHFSSIDLFKLYNDNLLCKLYNQHSIDYALYKALSIITSFKLNIHDKRYSITIPNKCRYLNLKRQFCFWYKRSGVKITLNLYDKIKAYIWRKIYYDENRTGHSNNAYGVILHKELVNSGKLER